MQSKQAFTLIELLIVVAIIGILAAIAIPNFLQAQVRAKTAAAQSELRTLAIGVEQYFLDNNAYAFDWDSAGWPWYITDVMTSPIPYVSGSSDLMDAFGLSGYDDGPPQYYRGCRYRFFNLMANSDPGWPPSPFPGPYFTRWFPYGLDAARANLFRERFGEWRLLSTGPDHMVYNPFDNEGVVIYDPTNGTISNGDIVRSQKNAMQED